MTTTSGKVAAFQQIRVIANNLANMNTTGFKSERLLFEKAVAKQHMQFRGTQFESDVDSPGSINSRSQVAIRGSFTDFAQGNIENTGNPLDVAVEGEGFFVVQTPDGERYTRAGNFSLDESGRLVTQNGFAVQGSGGDISVSGPHVQVSPNGEVKVGDSTVATLRVVQLDPKTAERESALVFKANGAVSDVTEVRVKPGALETSNVNAVRELVDMIAASRLYDSFQKTEESIGTMNRLRNQQVGSLEG